MDNTEQQKWRRYRLRTKSVGDSRPLIFNPQYPFWESGFSDTDAVMVAWLPENEDLLKYWDDAFDVEFTEHEQIEFNDRFPKPKYYVENEK